MAKFKDAADYIIDTSYTTPAQLKDEIINRCIKTKKRKIIDQCSFF